MSVIVDITHDDGTLNGYSSTATDSGDLSVAAAAALADSDYGLQLVLDDTNQLYGRYNPGTPNTSGVIRCRFYIDPNGLTMANTDRFGVLELYGNSATQVYVYLYYTTASGYQIRADIYNDAGGYSSGAYFAITDAPHYIELHLIRATGESTNDGSLQLWIDGTSKETLSGVDNYTRFSNFSRVNIGAGLGNSIDAGTSGTFFLDELVINDDGGEIGPVSGGNTELTVADSSHAHAAESKALAVAANLVTIANGAHAHAVDAVAAIAVSTLVVADTAHTHAVDAPALTVAAALAVADASHTHAADAVALTVSAVVIVADSSHAHAADNVTLSTTGQITLAVQNAAHAHTADVPALTVSANLVAVADTSHANAAEEPTLILGHPLTVADGLHAHTAETLTLTQAVILVMAGGLHAHTADNITLPGAGAGGDDRGMFRAMERAIEKGFVEL